MENTNPGTKQKKNTFEDLLYTVTLEEFREFTRKYALYYNDFKTKFELFFIERTSNPDLEKKYGDLIRKSIYTYSDHGYIDPHSARLLAFELDNVLLHGQYLIDIGNFSCAFSMSKAVLKALTEFIRSYDDSVGVIGGALFNVIQLFKGIAGSVHAPLEIKQNLFDLLQIVLAKKYYFDYGTIGYELFAVYRSLAVPLGQSESFIRFIDTQCSTLTGKYDDDRRAFFQKEKIGFYIENGWNEQAQELIRQNLDIVAIRQAEVEKAINCYDYTAAKQLVADGIKLAEEKKHLGTVYEWQKELLRIAIAENDRELIRSLSLYFMFDGNFNTETYRQWKQTFSEAEQKDAVERLITAILDEANRRSIGALYIEEQMWDRLLAMVQSADNLYIVLDYHDHLAKRYPEELLELYTSHFRALGNTKEGQTPYTDFAVKLKRVLRDIPKVRELLVTLVNDLKAQNPPRQALIEAITKVLKG
ncbi:MAG: hypothetical protein LBU99_05635 [Spirochaetaceae bacterium]|nr:hypothetical protein [Spirochaetaceae bacterium]